MTICNFNPHSHTGSDPCFCIVRSFHQISIHTPTQGVTLKIRKKDLHSTISIHTPTQGVTFVNFIIWFYHRISIHTPTQGVTNGQTHTDSFPVFQSTLPHREWQFRMRAVVILEEFQSTLPHREWPQFHCSFLPSVSISIHTPTQGVTSRFCFRLRPTLFQSTLPHREWLSLQRHRNLLPLISIHTPTQGVTFPHPFFVSVMVFQSTLPHREWLVMGWYLRYLSYFNPHSHTGSDGNFGQIAKTAT